MLNNETRKELQDIIGGAITEGRTIIAQQSEISLSKALAQVQLLKTNSKAGRYQKGSKPKSMSHPEIIEKAQ